MKITKLIQSGLILACTTFAYKSNAQVIIGGTPSTMNSDAMLEIKSSEKGLLIPKVELLSTTSPSPMTAHHSGMLIYNLSNQQDVHPGIYQNDGTRWIALTNQTVSTGNNHVLAIGQTASYFHHSSNHNDTITKGSFIIDDLSIHINRDTSHLFLSDPSRNYTFPYLFNVVGVNSSTSTESLILTIMRNSPSGTSSSNFNRTTLNSNETAYFNYPDNNYLISNNPNDNGQFVEFNFKWKGKFYVGKIIAFSITNPDIDDYVTPSEIDFVLNITRVY